MLDVLVVAILWHPSVKFFPLMVPKEQPRIMSMIMDTYIKLRPFEVLWMNDISIFKAHLALAIGKYTQKSVETKKIPPLTTQGHKVTSPFSPCQPTTLPLMKFFSLVFLCVLLLPIHATVVYSYFPGYSWTITYCRYCSSLLGWKFQRVHRRGAITTVATNENCPNTFFGFQSASVRTMQD